jgi:hypothetical protein
MITTAIYTAWLQLKISPGMKDALELLASDIGVTKSEMVRFLIIDMCEKKGGKYLQMLDVSELRQVNPLKAATEETKS